MDFSMSQKDSFASFLWQRLLISLFHCSHKLILILVVQDFVHIACCAERFTNCIQIWQIPGRRTTGQSKVATLFNDNFNFFIIFGKQAALLKEKPKTKAEFKNTLVWKYPSKWYFFTINVKRTSMGKVFFSVKAV